MAEPSEPRLKEDVMEESSYSRAELLKRGLVAGGAATLLGGDLFTRAAGAGVWEQAKQGGTLTVGIGQVLEDIDPLSADFYRWLQLVALSMYESPIALGDDGKLIPKTASKIEQPNPQTTILTVRPGVKF